MNLDVMLSQGFIKIEGQPIVYKQAGENLVVVYEDRGNGDYQIGDLVVFNKEGRLSAEEQILLEREFDAKFGRIAIV